MDVTAGKGHSREVIVWLLAWRHVGHGVTARNHPQAAAYQEAVYAPELRVCCDVVGETKGKRQTQARVVVNRGCNMAQRPGGRSFTALPAMMAWVAADAMKVESQLEENPT